MDPEPAGAKDTDPVAAAAVAPAPVIAASPTPLPEAPLPPDNVFVDTEPTEESVREMREKFYQQMANPPPPAEPVPAPVVPEPVAAVPPEPEPAAPAGEPAKFPQFRIEPRDEKQALLYKLHREGIDPQVAHAAVYGAAPPVAAAAPVPATPPAPAAPPATQTLATVTNEIKALAEKLKDPDLLYDAAAVAQIQADIALKQLERQDAIVAVSVETQRAAVDQETQRAREWDACCARRPEWDAANSPVRKEADVIFAAMQETNDPRLGLPNIATIVFEMADRLVPAAPPPAAPASSPVPPAPLPVPAARYTPAPVAGGPAAPARQINADDMVALYERDPAAYEVEVARQRRLHSVPAGS